MICPNGCLPFQPKALSMAHVGKVANLGWLQVSTRDNASGVLEAMFG